MRHECWECGRKETWREWLRYRRDRREWRKNPPPKADFADWISQAILDELRPGSILRWKDR